MVVFQLFFPFLVDRHNIRRLKGEWWKILLNYLYLRKDKYVKKVAKYFNARILRGVYFNAIKIYTRMSNANAWKIIFGWKLINTNCKKKIKLKYYYCWFILHNFWTYLNQRNKLKQTGIYSRKYMLQSFHIF